MSPSPVQVPLAARSVALALALAALALLAAPGSPADPDSGAAASPVAVGLDLGRNVTGGRIPSHFVGLSVEWSLIERYMGPDARPAFTNLLRNLGTGVLRVGGGSQDLMPFVAAAANSDRVITPKDLRAIRATLEAVDAAGSNQAPSWGAILGTAMTPGTAARHARIFVTHGVGPAFADAERLVAGIELGNEPDLTYRSDAGRYLDALRTFSRVTRPFASVAPNTSETIARWDSVAARTTATRFFWDWRAILDAAAPGMAAAPGPFGAFATDHFYPVARDCAGHPYRCATIRRLLSEERMSNLAHQVHAHATEAERHGLGYRIAEMNSAAGRGVAGVSDVAASAIWALDAMFTAACPQPPGQRRANADCRTGAIGVNFHNAEVDAIFAPEAGNAHYNAIAFDPTAAMAAPVAAPEYYAMLLFARFAQGTSGLLPVAVAAGRPERARLKAWRVDAAGSERRLFLINKGERPVTLTIAAPAGSVELDRMTPHDPTGAGRTVDAPMVRLDGRAVSADGSWPGFDPAPVAIAGGNVRITVGAAEAAVVTSPRERRSCRAR